MTDDTRARPTDEVQREQIAAFKSKVAELEARLINLEAKTAGMPYGFNPHIDYSRITSVGARS